MTQTELRAQLQKANRLAEADQVEEAIHILQRAASQATRAAASQSECDRLHGDLCRRLADLLIKCDRIPEAMQALQESVDFFSRVRGAEAEAADCARRIVLGTRAMRDRPDRLFLLIARLDRELRQLAEEPGQEFEQATVLFKSATILHRRSRFQDAVRRYLEAARLFRHCDGAELDTALCHFRLAGLYHYEIDNLERAEDHCRNAIRIYSEFEPITEGRQMNRTTCEELLRSVITAKLLSG